MYFILLQPRRWWPFDLETSAKIRSVYVLTLHRRRRRSMYGSSCVVYNHMSYCLPPPLRKFEFQSGGCNKAAVACCHKKQSGNQGGGGGARKWADSTLPHKIPEPHTKIFSCEHKKSWPMRCSEQGAHSGRWSVLQELSDYWVIIFLAFAVEYFRFSQFSGKLT